MEAVGDALISESQERMLAIVAPASVEATRSPSAPAGACSPTVIGEVTEGRECSIVEWHGETGRRRAARVAGRRRAPSTSARSTRPDSQDASGQADVRRRHLPRPADGDELREILRDLHGRSRRTSASKKPGSPSSTTAMSGARDRARASRRRRRHPALRGLESRRRDGSLDGNGRFTPRSTLMPALSSRSWRPARNVATTGRGARTR